MAHGLADRRFHSYEEEEEEEEEEMDRFLDSLKRHVVFPTLNSHTARKMREEKVVSGDGQYLN